MKLNLNRKRIIILTAVLALLIYSGGTALTGKAIAEATGKEKPCQCASCVKAAEKVHDEHEKAEPEEAEHEEAEHEECDEHDEHDTDEHEDHDDHDADEHEDCDGCDDHDTDEHEEHADCDDHNEENAIRINHETETMLKIQTATAKSGDLYFNIRLTGQIRLNQDNLAHIVPLTPGIVRKVYKRIGDRVTKNETLAWLESIELGQEKIKYLNIMAELGCCAMNLARSQQIHDNTLTLIEMLKSDPELDELRKLDGLEMGVNRNTLIKVYSEYIFAKAAYEREKSLYDQKISSEEDYLIAQGNFKKSEAANFAMLDTISFKVKQNLLETKLEQQTLDIALKGEERTLHVFGQTKEDIEQLNRIAQNKPGKQTIQHECSDPNCDDCVKKAKEQAAKQADAPTVIEADFSSLGRFPLKTPFDGIIIDKHITLGERISNESTCFTIADLDTVWIDLSIFPKDLATVKKGQTVSISSGISDAKGTISFVSPVLDSKTRTATARVILDNSKGVFQPGLFVTATLKGKAYPAGIIVNKEAVQSLDSKKCVFVKEGQSYEPRFVVIGRSDADNVEVISGLEKGELYISKGAFDLKAKIVTSTLDSHAGHGH